MTLDSQFVSYSVTIAQTVPECVLTKKTQLTDHHYTMSQLHTASTGSVHNSHCDRLSYPKPEHWIVRCKARCSWSDVSLWLLETRASTERSIVRPDVKRF